MLNTWIKLVLRHLDTHAPVKQKQVKLTENVLGSYRVNTTFKVINIDHRGLLP